MSGGIPESSTACLSQAFWASESSQDPSTLQETLAASLLTTPSGNLGLREGSSGSLGRFTY